MSDDLTPRLGMPMLQPGQAQKELFHNEALALIDIATQATVVAVGTATPPAGPVAGQCWVVGAGATGVWSGREGALAGWTAGGWRFITPREGMAVWSIADGTFARFAGSTWVVGEATCARLVIGADQVLGARRPAITLASGGVVVDVEARAAIEAVLTMLRDHGLIDP